MLSREITYRNVFITLIAGFALVILLLVAAAVVGARNIHSIQLSAASLVEEQSVTARLIDELERQQASVSDVFAVLARDPDSVDMGQILKQLDEADRDIDRISAEGAKTQESALWLRLKQSSLTFSAEARGILAEDAPETFAPAELFRDHEAFLSVVARLVEAEYRKVGAAQAEIDRRSAGLLFTTVVFTAASVLLALVFAAVTVRMAGGLIRGLEAQSAELARVSWHLMEAQEATAQRFSHELHDELGQSLTAVKTNLAALSAKGSSERLEDCARLIDEAIGNVRQMSQLLRPTILDDFGLEAGVRWLAEGFAARTGIEVEVQASQSGRLPEETETHLFRIAQEALTNVARHSGATRVAIRMDRQGREFRLTIEDNGRGLPAAPASGGMGLTGMRARARSAGGAVSIRSRPGHGVLIEVRVPTPRSS
ncbi:MAG: ATP-binding protein [Bryobacteraceae bacterium]|jgi:signal transduction histidine kinase